MLNVIISFRWRPTLHDNHLVNDLLKWADYYTINKLQIGPRRRVADKQNVPDVIVIGFGVHYSDEELFESHLSQGLLTACKKLLLASNKNITIIWLNQRPLRDVFHPYQTDNSKMQRFNKMARRIFKYFIYQNCIFNLHLNNQKMSRDSGVAVWDSGNWIGEEHKRACETSWYKRKDKFEYFHCSDPVHTSNIALTQINNVLINIMCN